MLRPACRGGPDGPQLPARPERVCRPLLGDLLGSDGITSGRCSPPPGAPAYLRTFLETNRVWAGDDAALGAIEAIKQAGREKIAVLGGSGTNGLIKMIMGGAPTLIIPAIEVTAMKYATQAPVRGRYILDSLLASIDGGSGGKDRPSNFGCCPSAHALAQLRERHHHVSASRLRTGARPATRPGMMPSPRPLYAGRRSLPEVIDHAV